MYLQGSTYEVRFYLIINILKLKTYTLKQIFGGWSWTAVGGINNRGNFQTYSGQWHCSGKNKFPKNSQF